MSDVLLIEALDAEGLIAIAKAANEAGYPPCDLLTPHPVEGVDELLAPTPREHPIGWVMVAAGALGCAIGYVMQWFSATIDYPTLSGGRPLHSWEAFVLVPYETTILFAAVAGILGWMAMCGLPKLHHMLFAANISERASQDRYLVVIPFTAELLQWARARFSPHRIHEVRG
ncbi:MAG: DUF3341 domain-containing protein [Burkholderiales bacterium]